MTLGQAALKWLLAEPRVVTTLPNIYDDEQLAEFAAASDEPRSDSGRRWNAWPSWPRRISASTEAPMSYKGTMTRDGVALPLPRPAHDPSLARPSAGPAARRKKSPPSSKFPFGSRNKYELDKTTGVMKLDRVLYSAVHYPGDYGFIPRTLHEDGDPLDVLVLVKEQTFSGCMIDVRPLGVLQHARSRGAGRQDPRRSRCTIRTTRSSSTSRTFRGTC